MMKSAFLSHATADKERYVIPFAKKLTERNISYWLDEAEIKWGDKIGHKINEGLVKSDFVVVFLTKSFVGRNWPETELSAALNRENDEGRTVVLPIVVGDPKEILAKYPLLRDKSYRLWNRGLDILVSELDNLIHLSHDRTSTGHDHRFGHSNRQISDHRMRNQTRLKKKIDDLQRQWELFNEKLSGLNEQWILETQFEEKFRLRKSIDDTKTQRDQVEEQLKEIESQLAKVDSDAKEVTNRNKEVAGRNDDQGPSTTIQSLPVENIHGWSASKVQKLQRQTAIAYGQTVEFCDTLKDGTESPTMVVIPRGRFIMGSPENEHGRWKEGELQHEVELNAFAIGKYTVTFEEYDRFTKETGRKKKRDWLGVHSLLLKGMEWGRGRRPVINVNWYDAIAYAEWLSLQTGQPYRLPTESEWEYACRAGTTTAYCFGESINHSLANYHEKPLFNYIQSLGKYVRDMFLCPREVGMYPANAWGLHDMHGNVWEWTSSFGNSESVVVRGGSWAWDEEPELLRCASRSIWHSPQSSEPSIGFRLVRNISFKMT